ncbi:unnamed protein product, partial [Polarella glacialis]
AQLPALRQQASQRCQAVPGPAHFQQQDESGTGEEPGRERQKNSVDTLTLINSQKARLAKLQSERVTLLQTRESCAGCLRDAGGFGLCAGAAGAPVTSLLPDVTELPPTAAAANAR